MINLSGIVGNQLIGKLLRLPLNLIPKGMVIPVLQGKLRGKKWIVGASVHGCWLGCYEQDKQLLFTKTITKESVVYDIGANVGFYTLLASHIIGEKGKTIAFEPFHRNLCYLKKHLQLNKCNNVAVIEAAVNEQGGVAFFEEGTSSSTGRISEKGSIKIETVKIDTLVSQGKIPPPDFIKIDVEGSELLVLRGAKSMLTHYYPTIFLATHGTNVHKECCDFLESIGYKLQSINKKDIKETDEILAVKRDNGHY